MFKQLYNKLHKTQQADGYETLADYLRDTELPIYYLDPKSETTTLVGTVPRMKVITDDTQNVLIDLSYPMIPLISEYKQDSMIQFNGTDIVISPKGMTQEHLYVPVEVFVHIGNEIVTEKSYKMPIEYGQTKVHHTIPCEQIAQKAVTSVCGRFEAFMVKEQPTLLLDTWQFVDGALHVYTKVVDVVVTKTYINGVPQEVQMTPTLATADINGLSCFALKMGYEQAEDLTELLAPSHKYNTEIAIDNEDGIDTLHISKSVNTDNFPDEYDVVKPFIDYLSGYGYYIDDEMVYDYYEQQKELQKGNYDTSKGNHI